MRRICVFCGSSRGADAAYLAAAKELGRVLVNNKLGLVFGGGIVGLMGAIAQTVVQEGGEVIGVIPKALARREVAYTELDDLRIVGSMHERKALMADLADGFVALPGGFGTFEEFFEVLTWAQLGLHNKPCGILNVQGYFDQLLDFLDHTVEQKFISPKCRSIIVVEQEPAKLIQRFKTYCPPQGDKAKWALRMKDEEKK